MFPIGLKAFSEIFSGYTLYMIIAIAIANGAVLFFASSKFLLVMQQGGYHGKRYFKWLLNPETPYLSRLMLLCLLGFLFFCLLCVCFLSVVGETITSYMGFLSYGLFIGLYIDSERNVNAKLPLKKTKRLVRLCITYAVILCLVSFGLILLVNFIAYLIGDEIVGVLRYALICLLPLLSPYMLFLAYLINEPFENTIKKRIVLKATAKLDGANVIKIGITGSFGKTSVKEILNTVLSQKFRVLSSPASYNTPMGIALTVKGLDSTHDIFIAEMGARNKGDIKELAEMIKPSIGVLTGINNQHLESFGSIERIKDTKFELFENLADGGMGFFSSDSVGAKELFDRFKGEKYAAGISGGNNYAYATDIKTDERGMSFDLHISGEKPVRCCTVLLGRHSVANVCLAAAVAYRLGLTPDEIAAGVNRIPALKHRLELLPNNKNIVIIDDSYNSNEDGTKAAMEVLDYFTGRKIVLTPGLVELGKMENVMNLEFGKRLARHADIVIVIGKHNAEMLITGLSDGGFDKQNIMFAKSLNKANVLLNEILKEGDIVLFENDLPDNYN
ncbi:MAG: UDP-N-acetylmuramoyl-tripeptide--D-alanyl-D-alanine ligase [Clostridia bacterium]|nr:UDP-N-acetylmuramoyl-tripeptide--D-alanyl-D-alanine ligase [Clostridia bacterium]